MMMSSGPSPNRRSWAFICLALFTVITALVAGLENDDLVFDHEGKITSSEVYTEQEHPESWFQSIMNWLNVKTDLFPHKSSEHIEKYVDNNLLSNSNSRYKREIKQNNEINDDSSSKSRYAQHKGDSSMQSQISSSYRQGDDEDDLGSGEPDTDKEIGGSTIRVDLQTSRPGKEIYTKLYTTQESHTISISPTTETNSVEQSSESDKKHVYSDVYRISMTIKEPYRKEFERREDEKFQKFAENLTKTVEEILHRNLKSDHHVTFVKVENAPDPFETHVELDVYTMNGESEVRSTLDKHINIYHALGKFTVNPLTFRLRAVVECQHGEIACDVSRCILQTQRCNFKQDCEDGSDETNCKYPACGQDDFICNSGQCIKGNLYCNSQPDCYDGSDEENCLTTCNSNEFRCLEGICISIDKRCNGYVDCRNGDDEDSCGQDFNTKPYPSCKSDEFECSIGYCISHLDVCNGRADCPDGKDERNCHSFYKHENESMLNLKVYPMDQIIKERSEAVIQCRDEGPLRARVRWIRGNGQQLPPGTHTNNGRLEIPHVQREYSGSYVCEAEHYMHLPGSRVVAELTVEKADPTFSSSQKNCKDHEATCNNEECILKHYVCDGKPDCSDGSDEVRCGHDKCEPNEFRCTNKQCVSKIWRCDGDKDCSDGSDEENCAESLHNAPCNYGEFKCTTNDQCIPKSYQCDHESDCLDGSDEIGCSPVYIVKPPPPMVVLDAGDTLSLTCTAIGVPIPEVNWRLNWGHIPQKCSTVSVNGTGSLDCPDVRVEDQGAYSCEGINVMGFVIAVPDTILVVKDTNICPVGKFNSEAKRPEDCISCFCFGVATECASANLFTYQIPLPIHQYKVIPVEIVPEIRILPETNFTESILIGNDGFRIQGLNNEINKNNIIYVRLPEHFNGNQLKSFGGYLHYDINFSGNNINNDGPAVIVSGNDRLIFNNGAHILQNHHSRQKVRFIYGEWYKQDIRGPSLASREDIMMVLANIDSILIKIQYENSPQLNVSITNVMLDSARNTGTDLAPFVEECRCPSGYTGLSCENCAPGYARRKTGHWLGQCYKEVAVDNTCPSTFYGAPARGIPCEPCPCPFPRLSGRTCRLDYDNRSPICDCPPGYEGKRCEKCAEGYQGNPMRGEECKLHEQCDRRGSLSTEVDLYTKRCRCKEYVTGSDCSQCKTNTFSLSTTNQFGCIGCFCMGITSDCVSSNWYRSEIRVSFTNSVRGFSLIGSNDRDSSPITNGINLNPNSQELIFNDFPERGAGDVYYWQLPSIFLGNQITAYGGNLKYTLRYVPYPGGLTSRNSAPDVELISSNDITLLYYSRDFPEPNIAKTVTVPLLEQYWQRHDGTTADREHLLMALADVEAIKIKATYTTHTYEAALSFVSLDIAEEFNIGNTRAIEVEKCMCPEGYQGLSCEDCAVGYTRAIEGLYLGICEPCKCNSHSHQCDPETGVCENCADHTTGSNCEICESGYEGDATRGTSFDCQARNGSMIPCHCNPLGSLSNDCANGQCYCKRNVEGTECNRCRESTFGLSQNNEDGCNECFCSGVSNQCHESSLYIQQIPTLMFDDKHGFTLTDSSRREVISDNFEINIAVNEIGYRYSNNQNKRLFWSLPSTFTGNKVKSYGGNLSLTQHITAESNSNCPKDQDVILMGNGITLYWSNPQKVNPGSTLVYSVPMKESEWRHVSAIGLPIATRSDLMTVLANIEAILIRASYCDRMIATYISDVSLDTAVEIVTGGPRATQVEACRCPAGYSGTSCETCAPGYYRNVNNRSVSVLGSCSPCPCNGNEQSCELDWSGHVKCNCLPQYGGQYCQDSADFNYPQTTFAPTTDRPSPIDIKIREPKIQIVKIGDSVRYHCSAKSLFNEPVRIKWEKEGGYLPVGRGIDDSVGVLFIREVKVSDSGNYICHVTDGVHVRTEKVTLHVGDDTVEPIIKINPSYLTVVEGEPAEFICEATGSDQSIVEWIRPNGKMNPNTTSGDGILRIPSVTLNDAAEYKCIVRSRSGISEKSTSLHVKPIAYDPTQPGVEIFISPPKWTGFSGDAVRLICNTSRPVQRIIWSRTDRLLLPTTATQYNGTLTISNPSLSDAGWYICSATLHDGREKSTTTSVTINSRHDMPMISIEPHRQKVPQGSTATIQCRTDRDESNIKWAKNREPTLGSNVQITGNTLYITNVQVSNRGIYTCKINRDGQESYEASAIIEVEPREMPILQVHPKEPQIVLESGTADFHCRPIAGIPTPEIKWSRQDNRPLGPNSQIISGGMLRINNVSLSDGGSYICIAENSVGVTSAAVNLEVHSLPKINITPRNGVIKLKSGEKFRLICTATGHPLPLVSWIKDYNDQPIIDPYKSTTFGPSATIDINSVTKDDEGTYICRARSTAGVLEDYVQLRIEEDNAIDYPENCRGDTSCGYVPPPEHPTNTELRVDGQTNIPSGGKVSINCRFEPKSNDNSIYLDWKREDGRPMPRGSTVNDGVLFLNDLRPEDSGEYTCFGVDSYGRQIFSAKTQLHVIDFPKVELRPTKQTVRPGESPSIHCIATGEQPLSVEWEAVGRPLPSSVSQLNGVLHFNGITFSDAGKYVCKASNDLGTAESVAEVSVEASATPIVKVQASRNVVNVGDSLDLHCVTSGIINPRYVWSRPYEISLPWNARQSGNILTLFDVDKTNNGVYRCAIDSDEGVVEDDFTLRVQDYELSTEGPYEAPPDVKHVPFGKTVELSCRDHLQSPIKYRWIKNNGSLPENHEQRDNILILNEVDANAAGVYICKAHNGQEIAETSTTVVVTGLVPHFSQAPLSYIKLPPLMDAYLKFDIEISFRPQNANGVLLYTSENPNGYGDFLSLTLEDSYPIFEFDLGSGPTIIRADRAISLRDWHTVVIRRDRKSGVMIVDDVHTYSSTSTGKRDGFDVHDPLYVGGIPDHMIVNEQVGVRNGFVGCVNRLVIGGKQIDLMKNMLTSQSITNCEICEHLDNPCVNGICQESSAKDGYECICNIGYTGIYCEQAKQSCQPGICGDGMCMETEYGYECDCPIGRTGENCQYSQMVRTPKLSHPRSYMAYPTSKSLNRGG